VGSFLHAYKSESRYPRGSSAESFDVKADAVVFHCEQQSIGVAGKPYYDLSGFGVAHDVCQRFLSYAETSGLKLAREPFILVGQVDKNVDAQAGAFCVTIDVPAQCGR